MTVCTCALSLSLGKLPVAALVQIRYRSWTILLFCMIFLFCGILKKLHSSYEAHFGKDNRGMSHHEWDPSYQPVCSPVSNLMNSICKKLNRLEFTCIGQQYLLTWWTVADVWQLQRGSLCELTAPLFKCKIIIRDQYMLLLPYMPLQHVRLPKKYFRKDWRISERQEKV